MADYYESETELAELEKRMRASPRDASLYEDARRPSRPQRRRRRSLTPPPPPPREEYSNSEEEEEEWGEDDNASVDDDDTNGPAQVAAVLTAAASAFSHKENAPFFLVQIVMQRWERFIIWFIDLFSRVVVSKSLPEAYSKRSVLETRYRYAKLDRRNPIWVGYVSYWLSLIFYVVFAIIISLYGWAVVSWALKGLLATNTQTVNIAEPLNPDYINEYVNDFCYTEGFSERALAMRRLEATANSINTRDTPYKDSGPVDADGNNITDASEFIAAEMFYNALDLGQQVELNELDPEQYIYGSSSSSSASQSTTAPNAVAPPAPSLVPPSNLLCDVFSQFNPRAQSLLLKRGCYDMLWFSLDFKYNKLWVSQETTRTKKVLDAKGRGFSSLQNTLDTATATNLMMHNQNQVVGRHDYKCVCSSHYGIANLWAYSTYVGESSIFLIDYDVVPLTPEESVESVKTMATMAMGYDDDPLLNSIDERFWQRLEADPVVLQPPMGIRVRTKLVPPKTYIERYYGPEYGDSLRASIAGLAEALDRKKMGPNGEAAVENNWFKRFLIWLDKSVRAKDDPTKLIDELNNNVMDVRSRLLIMRRNVTRENRDATKGSTSVISDTIAANLKRLASWGVVSQPDDDILLTQPNPLLVTNSSLFVPRQHSTCAVHCLEQHNKLMRLRQIAYNRMSRFTSPVHLNPPYTTYPFVSVVNRRKIDN